MTMMALEHGADSEECLNKRVYYAVFQFIKTQRPGNSLEAQWIGSALSLQ